MKLKVVDSHLVYAIPKSIKMVLAAPLWTHATKGQCQEGKPDIMLRIFVMSQ